jgi:hypothetical protein
MGLTEIDCEDESWKHVTLYRVQQLGLCFSGAEHPVSLFGYKSLSLFSLEQVNVNCSDEQFRKVRQNLKILHLLLS